MALLLSDLLTQPTADEVKAVVIAKLQAGGIPTTDWEAGAPERDFVEMESFTFHDLVSETVPAVAGGGFIDYAEGEWLTFLAKQRYNLDRNLATRTYGLMTLACAPTAGPYQINPGDLWAEFPSGNKYNVVDTGVEAWPLTLAPGGTLELTWASESPNDSANGLNYVDGSGLVARLLTPLAGVTITNPAPDFSTIGKTGTGTGSIALTRTAPLVAPTAATVVVRIDSTGAAGVAAWSYSVNGAAFVSAGAAASLAIPGTGTTVTLVNGLGVPSFAIGDVYAWAAPGTWITSQGTDEESDPSLRERCKARWPDLSDVPTDGKYIGWAKRASVQVKQVRVFADGTVPGKVHIVIAGQAGPLPFDTVSAVQAYILKRVDITDNPVTESAAGLAVTLAATVYVKAALLAAHQTAVQRAIASYIASAGINGVVDLSAVIDELRSPTNGTTKADKVDVPSVLINGANASLALSGLQVATFAQNLITNLNWVAT